MRSERSEKHQRVRLFVKERSLGDVTDKKKDGSQEKDFGKNTELRREIRSKTILWWKWSLRL